MYTFSKVSLNLLLICGLCSVSLAKSTVSKSSKSTSPNSKNGVELPVGDNVFLRIAKSLALEAFDEFKESARRSSRQAEMNMTMMPIMLPNGTFTNPFEGFNFTNSLLPIAAAAGIPVTIAVSAISLKTAIITGIAAIKATIINLILSVLWFFFLISGIAYFVCNLGVITCNSSTFGGLGGSLGGIGGGSGGSGGDISSIFSSSRAGLQDQYDRHTRPVYKALDEGYKKYH